MRINCKCALVDGTYLRVRSQQIVNRLLLLGLHVYSALSV